MQDDALCRKFLFDRTRHVSFPFGLTRTRRTHLIGGRFISRIVPSLASEGRSVAKKPKTWQSDCKSYFSLMWPQLRRNGAVNNVTKPRA
jgi:hypothetical protein